MFASKSGFTVIFGALFFLACGKFVHGDGALKNAEPVQRSADSGSGVQTNAPKVQPSSAPQNTVAAYPTAAPSPEPTAVPSQAPVVVASPTAQPAPNLPPPPDLTKIVPPVELDVPKPGSFGYGSWVEVRNCQPDAAISSAAGQNCLNYLTQLSVGKTVQTCTDDDRRLRKGGGLCQTHGSLCRSGSDGQGYRLWSCHVHSYNPQALKGGWSELRNCQSDGARSAEEGQACLSYLDSLGASERCNDVERLSGTAGGSCNREGKLCRSGSDGKGARVWVCHLPKPDATDVTVSRFKAVGAWLEVRNCQADLALGTQQYQQCLTYLNTIGAGAVRCTDAERQQATAGGACTQEGRLCRSGADGKGARLFVCH